MDFAADQLVKGNRFRALTIVDVCNRLVATRGAPKRLFTDRGSEFEGQMLDRWANRHGVQIDFSRPGKPTDNSFVESFNGSLRDECSNVNGFESIDEAKTTLEDWRRDYDESRPHQALGQRKPLEC